MSRIYILNGTHRMRTDMLNKQTNKRANQINLSTNTVWSWTNWSSKLYWHGHVSRITEKSVVDLAEKRSLKYSTAEW